MPEQERHVQIKDFSDREILALFIDMGGMVTAAELAVRIFGDGLDDERLAHYKRCVTSRLAWMRRFGLVERAEPGFWQISKMGQELRTNRVSDAVALGIDRMADNRALDLGHTVGIKLVGLDEVQGRAMQRELQHQINRRRSRLRGW